MNNLAETLIVVPTYNESDNVFRLYTEIKALSLDNDFLFVDDNSPDGTGVLLKKIAANDSSVKVIHRAGKLGIGSAHLQAIQYAIDRKYKYLITMDADFTHLPSHIPSFLDNASEAPIVVGSRFLNRNSLDDWNLYRKCMTNLGHFLTRRLLKLPQDATGAFRLYQLDKIDPRIFSQIKSNGYAFFFESLYWLVLSGLKIKEIPVVLPKRTYGSSKMRLSDVAKSLVTLFALFWRGIIFRINKKIKKNKVSHG